MAGRGGFLHPYFGCQPALLFDFISLIILFERHLQEDGCFSKSLIKLIFTEFVFFQDFKADFKVETCRYCLIMLQLKLLPWFPVVYRIDAAWLTECMPAYCQDYRSSCYSIPPPPYHKSPKEPSTSQIHRKTEGLYTYISHSPLLVQQPLV